MNPLAAALVAIGFTLMAFGVIVAVQNPPESKGDLRHDIGVLQTRVAGLEADRR